eukprot:scaffold744_cov240-Pinguiococcus_pyrenoidosus.AAC.4
MDVPSPNRMPFGMENENGIIASVRNAGSDCSMLFQSIRFASPIIMAPTTTRIGAVAVAGTRLKSGAKKSEQRKKMPTKTAVRPVRPPSLMPAALSTWMMMGEQP